MSCERDFDNNANFNNTDQVEIFGNNDLLFNKIFQFTSNGTYLWFDIRNEIANFSAPTVGLNYLQNDIEYYKIIDLRGRLYRYDQESNELTVLSYPLNLASSTDLPSDIVFGFKRKQSEGCDAVNDPSQHQQCERTFVLTLKRVEIKDIHLTITTDEPTSYDSRTVQLQDYSADIFLTN
jgi:hypothetical protein